MSEPSPIRERVAENDEDEKLRAAVYARTSTTSQEYGYSLDEQVKRSVDRCQSLGWTVAFVYRDEAESGSDTDRPMFQEMLSMADRQTFDVIVFWKLDRFSRSLMHAVKLESRLRDNDVYLYSLTEQIDTTSATGRFNFRNLASAAQFERDMIKQRTTMGLNALASDAKWPNNNPPLGYELDSNRRLAVLDEERDLVIQIFELYAEQRSMPDVAEQLNERGIRTNKGQKWTPRAVGDILRNEIYIGQYEVGDVSKHVPEYQIVSDDKFQEVTSIRRRFQTTNESRASMPESRKKKSIKRVKEMYDDYLDGCR